MIFLPSSKLNQSLQRYLKQSKNKQLKSDISRNCGHMIFKWDMCSDGVKFGPSLGVTNESKYLLFPLAIATITNTNSENKNIFNIDIICLICKLLYVSMYFFSYWETTDTISEPTYQYLYPRILPHSGRYPHLSFQIGILPWIPPWFMTFFTSQEWSRGAQKHWTKLARYKTDDLPMAIL